MTLAAGVESATVGEMSVEIASKAIGSTPRIESLFSGLVFSAQVSPAGQGRFALTGELTWQDSKGEPRSFDPNSSAVGIVELNALDQTESSVRMTVESGVWTRIHAARIEGSDESFLLVARVR